MSPHEIIDGLCTGRPTEGVLTAAILEVARAERLTREIQKAIAYAERMAGMGRELEFNAAMHFMVAYLGGIPLGVPK